MTNGKQEVKREGCEMSSVHKFLRQLCTVYTVSAMLLLLLNLAGAGTLTDKVIEVKAFLMVFPFAAEIGRAHV